MGWEGGGKGTLNSLLISAAIQVSFPLFLPVVQMLLLLHLLFIFFLAWGLLREVSLCSAGCS